MDRASMVRSKFNATGFGLEIGPSHQPVFPKNEGFTVETLDHTTADELRRIYTELGVATDRIEEVDYVSDGRALHEVIDNPHRYDFIFSSHAIEHVTDFVGYLKSCEVLLKPGGMVALAIPDKRYTFDVLRQITSTGQVLEAHARAQTRHTPAAAFDFVADFAALGDRDIWGRADRGVLAGRNTIAQAKSLFDMAMRDDAPYYDVHGWVFTPSSFRLILHDLFEAGMTTLREVSITESPHMEFFVELSSSGKGSGLSRLQLRRRSDIRRHRIRPTAERDTPVRHRTSGITAQHRVECLDRFTEFE